MSILEYKETRFQVILNDHFGVCPLVHTLWCDQLCLTIFVMGVVMWWGGQVGQEPCVVGVVMLLRVVEWLVWSA